MMVPPNHPFIDGFSIMSHPFLGYPHSRKPPYEWYPARYLVHGEHVRRINHANEEQK